jgi:penicillin-binding protein 1B
LRVFFALTSIASVALVLYLGYLDAVVRTEFEGKRWALPARVYARPMELYVGMRIGVDDLSEHLKELGYQKQNPPGRPGRYNQTGNLVELVTRKFRFWDGEEASLHLRLEFDDTRLAAMRETSGRRPELVRLDPKLIAGIYPSHNEDRILVRRDELPDLLVDGLLAVEDRHFFEHKGFDPKAVARALVANIRAGRAVQGGSTLTQQLVKNFFLSNDRTLRRKFTELWMALLVEWRYGKDEILEAYANEVYAGQDGQRAIHGFGLASQFYFGRPLQELAPEHMALLVGILRGPSYYDPRRFPDRALKRRDLVLALMRDQGYLDPRTATTAISRPLGVTTRTRGGITQYPAFLDMVRRQLRRDYADDDLTSDGLQVFTTLDIRVQSETEQALGGGIPILEQRHGMASGNLQGAGVFLDPQNGEVLALVGGRNPRESGFNRALDARRPVGSLIKPFVYLRALSQPTSFNLTSQLEDKPLSIEDHDGKVWTPQNYNRRFHGEVTLREALANSYNVATVRLGMEVGLPTIVEALRGYGVEAQMNPFPSLLLGAVELSPSEVANLYQVLASGGFRMPLRGIREVVTAEGRPLQRYPLTVEAVAPTGPVFLTTEALQMAVATGTGRSLLEKVPDTWRLAGKTGTSSGHRDSWFAAYSGDLLGVVWLGRDDNEPTGLSGASGALRVFGDAVRDLPMTPLDPLTPEDVEWLLVDTETGLLADNNCLQTIELPFMRGYGPHESSSCTSLEKFAEDVPDLDSWFRRTNR